MSRDKNLDNPNFGISTMIATLLQTKDLLSLCFVNQRWLNSGNNPIIWKSKFISDWLLFTLEKPSGWTYLKWVSYCRKKWHRIR